MGKFADQAEEAETDVFRRQAGNELAVFRFVLGPDRAQQHLRPVLQRKRFFQFLGIRADRQFAGLVRARAGDADAGVQRQHAVLVGQQRVDVHRGQRCRVGSREFGQSHQGIGQRVDVGRRARAHQPPFEHVLRRAWSCRRPHLTQEQAERREANRLATLTMVPAGECKRCASCEQRKRDGLVRVR